MMVLQCTRCLPICAIFDDEIRYSIDVNGCIIFQKGKVPGTIKMIESDISTEDAVQRSSIVVTGVPSPNYKVMSDISSCN